MNDLEIITKSANIAEVLSKIMKREFVPLSDRLHAVSDIIDLAMEEEKEKNQIKQILNTVAQGVK